MQEAGVRAIALYTPRHCQRKHPSIRLTKPLYGCPLWRGAHSIVESLNPLVREVDIKRLETLQVLDLGAIDDREDVLRLLHDSCSRNRSDALRTVCLRDLLELEADIALLGCTLPVA